MHNNDNAVSVPSLFAEYPETGTFRIPVTSWLKVVDASRPVNLISCRRDGFDETSAHLDNEEYFEVRQTAEDGECHVLLMSRAMVIEMMGLMNAWVSLG